MNKHVLMIATALTSVVRAFDGLKAVYDAEGDIPEGAKDFYKEVSGKWELQVEIPGVEGAKTFKDFRNLGEALRKERNDHKAVKATLGSLLGGRKPEEVQADLDRIPDLEAQIEANGNPKQVETIVEARIKGRLAPVERERDQLRTQLSTKDARIQELESNELRTEIRTELRGAGSEAKIIPEAIDDMLLLGDRIFERDSTGKIVTKDGVGVTPGLSPKHWLEEILPKRQHWLGGSSGGGAGGGRPPNRDGGPNPFTHEHWNMTAQGTLVRENREKAERMAKAAGTTIGGARPAPKK